MFKNIFQRLCERLTNHGWRKGYAYSEGISPIEFHYHCRICRLAFWNYKPYKGAPQQDNDYNPQILDDINEGDFKNMRQIRSGVFETNSSSTHSLTLCTDEEYKKFESGELVWDNWHEELASPDSSQDEGDYSTYHGFFSDHDDLEKFHKTYTTKSGEVIHAFGKYGYEG